MPIGGRPPRGRGGDSDGPCDRDARIEELLRDGRFLVGYSHRMLRDFAAAEDVAQDTYVQALRHLDHLDRRDSFGRWLWKTSFGRNLNERRRRSRLTPVESVPDRPSGPNSDPEHILLMREEWREVSQALEALTPRELRLFARRRVDGLSIAELAAEDGSTGSAVRSVLWRAKAKFEAALRDIRAHVVLPLGVLAGSFRRHVSNAGGRIQQAAPALSPGADRLGEAVAAVVAVVALGSPAVAEPVSPVTTDEPSPSFALAGTTSDPTTAVGAAPAPNAADPPGEVRGVSRPSAPSTGTGSETPDSPPPEPTDRSPLLPEPEPTTPPAPPPPSGDPGEPESPTPKDHADDPEGAFFGDIVWVGDSGQATGSDGGDAAHVFALGEIEHRCDTDCTVLFHSADRGVTWHEIEAQGIGDEASHLLVAPGYPDDPRLFVMTSTGLRMSGDGGSSFRPVNEPHVGPAVMSPMFGTGDERILIGAGPGWVYDAAADATTPFGPRPFATPTQVHFAFAPPDDGQDDLLFAGHFVHGQGGTKTPVVTRCRGESCDHDAVLPNSSQPPKVRVARDADGEGLTVLAWHDRGLFRSQDLGETFEPVDLGFGAHIEAVSDDGDGTLYLGWWRLGDNGRTGGVLRSLDAGRTWGPVGTGTALDEGVSAVQARPGGLVLAAPLRYPGGVLCSTDQGSTWAPRCPEGL